MTKRRTFLDSIVEFCCALSVARTADAPETLDLDAYMPEIHRPSRIRRVAIYLNGALVPRVIATQQDGDGTGAVYARVNMVQGTKADGTRGWILPRFTEIYQLNADDIVIESYEFGSVLVTMRGRITVETVET